MSIHTTPPTSRTRSHAVGPLMALALVAAACSGATTSSGSTPDGAPSSSLDAPNGSTQAPELGALSWIFDTPVAPIDVGVVLDTAKTVEAVIPVEGGTISATGTDGTVYTMEIPRDALLDETTIGLTPVTSVSGMPFGGEQTYAVQLSPEGLFLYKIAVLTITPAEPIPVGEQLVFGYLADGKDLTLAPPVVDSSEIKVQVLHFSGNGVTKGLLADIEPVRERLGGNLERRMNQAVAEHLGKSRDAQLRGEAIELPDFESVFRAFEEQVVKLRVGAAGESCAAGRLAIQTVLGLERQRQLLGMSTGGHGLDEYPGLLDTAARVCVQEEFELCVEDHVIHRMAGVWRSLEHQFAVMGESLDQALFREAQDLTIKCLTFRLAFESTATVRAPGGGGYESSVTSEITLRLNLGEDRIRGEAPLVNEAFEYFTPACVATGVRGGGGPFRVLQLKILTGKHDQFSTGPATDDGREVNFLLTYLPGDTSESAILSCPDDPPVTLPTFPHWTDAFVVTHAAELDSNAGGYNAIDWEVFGDEYFAKKEWTRQVEEFVDAGTLKLYHTPGA